MIATGPSVSNNLFGKVINDVTIFLFSAQPCAPQPPTMIVEDPNGGYINPLYALSVQTENNDSNFIATTSTAGTTGGNAGSGITVGTAVDGTVGGTVSGGTPGDAGGAVAANTAVGGTSGSNVSGGTGDGGIKPSPASEDGQVIAGNSLQNILIWKKQRRKYSTGSSVTKQL